MTLAELIAQDKLDITAVERFLNGLDHGARVAATRDIPRQLFSKLYGAAGHKPLSLTYFVPDSTPALKPVRHFGTNSLPMFRAFEKPMFRDAGGILGGRNVQTWQAFTGPGYYVVEPPQGSNELVLDYTRLPGAAPDGWPKLKSNEGGLSHFVFRGLRDTMRYVSEHVSIGTAIRDGKPQEQYFILVREN